MEWTAGEPRYQHTVRWTPSLIFSGLAGLVASIPMGLAMIFFNRVVSKGRATPEPPKQITKEMAERAGVDELVPPGRKWGLPTWFGHLGYGAATAALYPVTTYRLPLPPVVSGMLFALFVWAGSYLGWLPALNILPPATQQPARRNAVMIGTHLLWGGLVGLLVKQLERKEQV